MAKFVGLFLVRKNNSFGWLDYAPPARNKLTKANIIIGSLLVQILVLLLTQFVPNNSSKLNYSTN